MYQPPVNSPQPLGLLGRASRASGRYSESYDDLAASVETQSNQSMYSVAEYYTHRPVAQLHNRHDMVFAPTPPQFLLSSFPHDTASIRSSTEDPTLQQVQNLSTFNLPEPAPTYIQSTTHLPHQPVEYHPSPIARQILSPDITMSPEDEDALRLDTLFNWTKSRLAHEKEARGNPAHLQNVDQPVIIWRSSVEKVFEMKSRPWIALQTGAKIECHGVIVGTWTLTARKRRRTQFGMKKYRRLQEWVYVWIENEELDQEFLVKMPAHAYYPPTLPARLTSSMRKVGAFFLKHRD
ncbi:hypothetical protein C8R46DRAFT_1035817 [Mycena filopes]|nr:hypothetical protein C8R46DRAFT_1041149 [Mycena filopes]KAJ7165216.1 hypothetical protein C8R46DRAFT_1035817 [Mycena filopes]